MRIGENVGQGYEGASLKFTVCIIIKVSSTEYLEKIYFFTRVQKKMFCNPTSTKPLVLGGPTKPIFFTRVYKNKYACLNDDD